MKNNSRYGTMILSVVVAVLLISTVFGMYPRTNSEDTENLMIGDIPEIDKETHENYSTATFGVWCYWGPDARLGVVEGVIRTRTGYQEVKGSIDDDDGSKMEAIRVDHDPEKVSYMELYDMVSETGQLKEYHPLADFLLADRYHQSYQIGQHEELSEYFENIYPKLEEFTNSTAAARINGYLMGYGELDSPEDLTSLGLTEKGRQEVYDIWGNSRTSSADMPMIRTD